MFRIQVVKNIVDLCLLYLLSREFNSVKPVSPRLMIEHDGFIGCARKEAQSGSIVTLDPLVVRCAIEDAQSNLM